RDHALRRRAAAQRTAPTRLEVRTASRADTRYDLRRVGKCRVGVRAALSSGPAAPCGVLERVLVANESGVCGDLVVQPPRGLVVISRHPIDAEGAAAARRALDLRDQRPSGAAAARAFIDEEILQVANARLPHVPVKEIMDDADEAVAVVRTQSVNFAVLMEAHPDSVVHVSRETFSIERVISPSERLPSLAV